MTRHLSNDLPAVKILDDTAILPLAGWDDLIARLYVAEGRLAAHHNQSYDITCEKCQQVRAL